MKAITLLGTLRKDGASNTETLLEFLQPYLAEYGIENEIVRLAQFHIATGSFLKTEEKDDFGFIFDKMAAADVIIFATPIWWNSHSSEIQRVIERLDDVYRMVANGQISPFDGKKGGVVITGADDGVEHITGNIFNFFTNIGLCIPPFASLGVIWHGHDKGNQLHKEGLLGYYERNYKTVAESFARQMAKT